MNKEILSRAFKFIDSWLSFRQTRVDIPGLIVAISYRDKVVFRKACGLAQLDPQEEITTGHLFRIASQAKSFTAVALLQLAERKKLNLDDKVIKYLPWLKLHDDKRMAKVTVRQLLSHGAGLTRDGYDSDFWDALKPFPNKRELKEIVLAEPLYLDTNVEMKYSNIGYGLLGLVVEAVSSFSVREYMAANIFLPLHLKNTGIEYEASIKDRLVTGYTRRDNGQRQPISKSIEARSLSAATGFYSSAPDLCTFYSALRVGSKKLLDDESKKILQQTHWEACGYNQRREYGLGLMIEYAGKRRLFGHGGGFPGQRTFTTCDPSNQIVVTVMANAIDVDARSINSGIWSVLEFFEQNFVSKPKWQASQFEGRYMSLWSIAELVSWGNRIVTCYPDSWYPFSDLEDLAYVDSKTLKIIDTDVYSAKNQLLRFAFNNKGGVKSVNYAGKTMLPGIPIPKETNVMDTSIHDR